MSTQFRWGEGAPGPAIMKFTLTYDGELRSNAPRSKWDIRKHLSPQLEELWRIDPSLQDVLWNRYAITNSGWMKWETHHSVEQDHPPVQPPMGSDYLDLCQPIECGGRKFLPLVRESLALKCGLKILFLRKEEPGRVYQGGDIDNRLKTLFDALSVPNQDQIADDPTVDGPIYCLLEDDALISGVSVETQRLLTRPNSSKHEVRLVIEVEVRVVKPRLYNQVFLGD